MGFPPEPTPHSVLLPVAKSRVWATHVCDLENGLVPRAGVRWGVQ